MVKTELKTIKQTKFSNDTRGYSFSSVLFLLFTKAQHARLDSLVLGQKELPAVNPQGLVYVSASVPL